MLEIGVDDALGVGEVEAPHDADAFGDRLVHARELGVAGGLDQRAVEFLVQARDAHLRLWADLVRGASGAWVAPPAALLAFTAWQCGDGPLASIAIDRALACDPGYSMALLLRACGTITISSSIMTIGTDGLPTTFAKTIA